MGSLHLDADGQTVSREAAGDRYTGNPGKICRNCQDVGKIYSKRIVCMFTDSPGRGRGYRRDDQITFGKGPAEIILNQGSNLGGLFIIGIIIARRRA